MVNFWMVPTGISVSKFLLLYGLFAYMVNFWWDKRGPYIRNRLYLPENLKPETLWINAAIAEKRETEIDLYGHCQVWAPVSGQGEYL